MVHVPYRGQAPTTLAIFAGAAFDWLTTNAGRYGWNHPAWAQAGGSKPEPWHWEYGAIS